MDQDRSINSPHERRLEGAKMEAIQSSRLSDAFGLCYDAVVELDSCGKGSDGRYHASVRIDEDTFLQVRAYLLELAMHESPEGLQNHFEHALSFTPYARIRRQILRLVREINEKRSKAGFALIAAPSLRRQIVRPFKEVIDQSESVLAGGSVVSQP